MPASNDPKEPMMDVRTDSSVGPRTTLLVTICRHTFVLFALSLALLATPTQARAAFPGANGKIVFSSQRDGNNEIYTMNPDGSDRVDLTRNPASDITPEWSPDGRGIAFASNRSGGYQVYVM